MLVVSSVCPVEVKTEPVALTFTDMCLPLQNMPNRLSHLMIVEFESFLLLNLFKQVSDPQYTRI